MARQTKVAEVTEDWRRHPFYSDIAVSSNGRVMSYKRGAWRELKQSDNGLGYYRVGIGHSNPQYVHVLVAQAFLSNDDPVHKTQVDHLNNNRGDNRADNLEWVTASENDYRAFARGSKVAWNKKGVKIVETGEVFETQRDCAVAINGQQASISRCLVGRTRTHKNYHFEFVEE